MEDWEDESVEPVLKKALPKNSWDDEDADDDEVKESWEDDEEPTPAPLPAPEPPAEKSTKKPADKSSEKKIKVAEVAEVSDPVAEKLRQQRLVEEADYKSTAELFGRKEGDDDKSLDTFIPKSESDFSEYAELIAHKLRPYEKSYHYMGLLKAVMRLSMASLKGAEAKEVASSITAVANEKIKAEKEATAGKKKGGKKKQLLLDKPDEDVAANAYEALDDYDFM